MTLYLQLFWSFFQVGLFSFGGGLATMPLIQDQVVNISYAQRAEEAYKNCTLTILPGEGHGFSPEAQAQVIEAIKKLLYRWHSTR